VKYIFSNSRKERCVKKKFVKIFYQHGKNLFEKMENEEILSNSLQKEMIIKERIILAHLSVICDDKDLIESILNSSNSPITVQSENNWDSQTLLGFIFFIYFYFLKK
jgi:hypothetical protein